MPPAAPGRKGRVFISHTHADRELADALSGLFVDVLGGHNVEVHYSTSKEFGSGPRAGEDWFRWIEDEVRHSDVALVLLTPSSVQKPWVLWETGAVYGVSLQGALAAPPADAGAAAAAGIPPRVRPLRYKLSDDELPGPFLRLQVISGDQREDVLKLFQEFIYDVFKDFLIAREQAQADVRLQQKVLDDYLRKVEQALLKAPLTLTEGAVQEWLRRIEEMRAQNRQGEAQVLQQWMDVAFGRESNEVRPLDLRLHRALAEMHLAAGNYHRAVDQFELARRLAPRDLLLLRRLGQALLNTGDKDRAWEVVQRMESLVSTIFRDNAECAAFKARCQVERGQRGEARTVLAQALDNNPDSYYLADLLGQSFLDGGEVDGARQAYQRVLGIIERSGALNVWIHAAAATAHLVQGDEPRAVQNLRALLALRPSASDLDAIERGLKKVQAGLGLPASAFEGWRKILREA